MTVMRNRKANPFALTRVDAGLLLLTPVDVMHVEAFEKTKPNSRLARGRTRLYGNSESQLCSAPSTGELPLGPESCPPHDPSISFANRDPDLCFSVPDGR